MNDKRRHKAFESMVRDAKATAEKMGNSHVTEREIRKYVAEEIAHKADKDLDSAKKRK